VRQTDRRIEVVAAESDAQGRAAGRGTDETRLTQRTGLSPRPNIDALDTHAAQCSGRVRPSDEEHRQMNTPRPSARRIEEAFFATCDITSDLQVILCDADMSEKCLCAYGILNPW